MFAGDHDQGEHPRLFTTEFAADIARLNQCSEALFVNTSMCVHYKFDTGIGDKILNYLMRVYIIPLSSLSLIIRV